MPPLLFIVAHWGELSPTFSYLSSGENMRSLNIVLSLDTVFLFMSAFSIALKCLSPTKVSKVDVTFKIP